MAMALASMNPMVGSATGALMIKQRQDKDLEYDPWKRYSVTRAFDSKERLTLDEGKLVIVDNSDLRECTVYKILHPKTDTIFAALLAEVAMENRPDHDPTFLYQCFTGHYLLTEDQLDYDNLLERVYLDKLTKRLNGDSINLDMEVAAKQNRKAKYRPFGPTAATEDEEDGSTVFPLLASQLIQDGKLELLSDMMDRTLAGEDEEIVDDI